MNITIEIKMINGDAHTITTDEHRDENSAREKLSEIIRSPSSVITLPCPGGHLLLATNHVVSLAVQEAPAAG